jgi:hypothetical protein
MSIQHASISDPHIHEPKGVASAAADSVYFADGAGSGDWLPIDTAGQLISAESLLDSMNVGASQGPSALDTTYQMVFGSASGTGSDPVMIDGTGLITFNEAGSYLIRIELQFGRTGGGGTSILHFRALLNGIPTSRSYTAMLDAVDIIRTQSITLMYNVAASDELTFEMIRDPAGANSGLLLSGTITAAGWTNPSPNTRIVIQRLATA